MITRKMMKENKVKILSGVVIKGIGGFYYVKVNDDIIEAKGRGILKRDGKVIRIGDEVRLELGNDYAVITDIYERKNDFIRPPMSNVDAMLVVIAAENPKPNFDTIDKLIVIAEKNNIEIAIAITKCDIATYEEIENIKSVYEGAYEIFEISNTDSTGINEILEFAKGKKVSLAGASGVGKSTIINNLKEKQIVPTGELSFKTNRGKHTTKHVEIFVIDGGGMVYDTPGFSSFDLSDIESNELINYYPELIKYTSDCKFKDCAHIKENSCSLREAVRLGNVNKSRYLSYKKNYLELKEKERY